jgi:peptidoglycan hydrolase CwlO-like protein
MEKTREKHLEQINQCLDRIELDLIRKPDSDDLEFKWDELVAKLEEIHDEMKELKGEVADVKSQIEDLENGDLSSR